MDDFSGNRGLAPPASLTLIVKKEVEETTYEHSSGNGQELVQSEYPLTIDNHADLQIKLEPDVPDDVPCMKRVDFPDGALSIKAEPAMDFPNDGTEGMKSAGSPQTNTTESIGDEPELCTRMYNTRKRKNFRCNECGIEFDTECALINHNGEHSDACDEINRKSGATKTKSKNAKQNEKRYTCDQCPFTSVYYNRLLRHQRTHIEITCGKCDFRSQFKWRMELHMRRHKKKKSSNKAVLKKAIENKNTQGVKACACNPCDYTTCVQDQLDSHGTIHAKPNICDNDEQNKLDFHKSDHENSKTNSELNHERNHGCGKLFENRYLPQLPRSKSPIVITDSNDECSGVDVTREVDSNSVLNVPELIIVNSLPASHFLTELPLEESSRVSSLEDQDGFNGEADDSDHSLILNINKKTPHASLQKVKGPVFNTKPGTPGKSGFKVKKRGRPRKYEKPSYQCEICDFKTYYHNCLVRHQRAHKLFSCSLCDYRTYCSKNLTSHKRSHKEMKCYRCEVCNIEYSYRLCLERHFRNAHASLRDQ